MLLGDVVSVPVRYLDDDVCAAIGDRLAGEARASLKPGRVVQLVFLVFAGLRAGLKAFVEDDVTGRASADASAGMIYLDAVTDRDLKDRARLALSGVGERGGIDDNRLTLWLESQ